MKHTKIVQSRFIKGSDGFESSAEFNQVMMELADLNPKWEREGDSFWVFYSVEKIEAENVSSSMNLPVRMHTALNAHTA